MSLRSLAVLALVATPLALTADQDSAPTLAAEPSVLDHMEAFKTNLKAIAMGFADPERKGAVLAATLDFQAHAQAAKLLGPANTLEVPEAERAAHTLAFRKSMIALQHALLDLEVKLLDGDVEGVGSMIRGELFAQRNAAHEKFQSSR